jgi:hypothetical protein
MTDISVGVEEKDYRIWDWWVMLNGYLIGTGTNNAARSALNDAYAIAGSLADDEDEVTQ